MTNNITDLTRKALRNGGYEEDSKELISASVIGVSQDKTDVQLVIMGHFVSCNGRIFICRDGDGCWIADY